MKYETALKLKDAGFPQGENLLCICDETLDMSSCGVMITGKHKYVHEPTLSELIAACGDGFGSFTWNGDGSQYTNVIIHDEKEWIAQSRDEMINGHGQTPEEAVAHLWLELNKKK